MRSPRAILLLPAIAGALALALSSSGCGTSTATLDPVAQAAETTSRVGGAHIALALAMSVPGLGQPFTMTGQGFFNYKREEGTLSLDATSLPAGLSAALPSGPLHIEEIFKSSSIYVGSPLLAGKLPGGAHWLKIDLGHFAQSVGLNLQQLAGGQSNPAQLLQYLRATGGVELLGSEVVRGVPATHYRATIDLGKVADVLPSTDRGHLRAALAKLVAQTGTSKIPVGVWVDAQHLVRRLTLAFPVSTGAQKAQLNMTMELFEFGPTPTLAAPPSGEVFDATQTALAGTGSSGG
jgi:hypothetical protein